MNERGKFIVFEGVGGSGKTTHVQYSGNYLRSLGRNVIVTLEPGGIKEAESIRRLIFKLRSKNLINPDHQMALFFAARHLWIEALVAPNIDRGIDVLTGRSYPSTGAYQGYAEGGNLEAIRAISESVLGKYKPDAIVLLDISAEVAKARNEIQDDPYDAQGIEYFKKIVFGYREMARQNWSGVPWYVVDTEPPIDEVSVKVKEVLNLIVAHKIPR